MPLYEAFYFDSSASIKRHFLAAPRLAIQTALADPYQYLQVVLETCAYMPLFVCVHAQVAKACIYVTWFPCARVFNRGVWVWLNMDRDLSGNCQNKAYSSLSYIGKKVG